MSPAKYPITESGNVISFPRSRTSFGFRLFVSMKRAKSPTTFDDGVTLTMSPSISLTTAYIRFSSGRRSPRFIASACGRRLLYCPPGISWT